MQYGIAFSMKDECNSALEFDQRNSTSSLLPSFWNNLRVKKSPKTLQM